MTSYQDTNGQPPSDKALAWFELEKERIFAADKSVARDFEERQAALERELVSARQDVENTPSDHPFSPPQRKEKGPRTIIVGAGLAGLCMGAGLLKAGFDDFIILEKASELGGVWHYNRYPGVACDVNSYVYQFSYFKNYDWSGSRPNGDEIHRYLEDFTRHFGVDRHLRFYAEVESCTRRDGTWHVRLADGETMEADVLVAAVGALHLPNIPSIEGMDDFHGECVHSSTWKDSLDVTGKRVAVVGNGASGVQIIPNIADKAETLTLFQRTAQWIFPVPRDNYSALRIEMLKRYPELVDRIYDLHLMIYADQLGTAWVGNEEARNIFIGKCGENLSTVKDDALREKLTPDYPVLCKRIVISDDFYDYIQKDNVEVVTQRIHRFEEGGIRTVDGVLHELDVIILATGFDTHLYCRSLNISVEGGPTLDEAWTEGAQALDSVMVADFPNFFVLGGPYCPNGNLSASVSAEFQVDFIVKLLEGMVDGDFTSIAASPAAQRSFVERMQHLASKTIWLSGCNSWYIDEHGRIDIWPQSPRAYIDMLKAGPSKDAYEFA